MKADRVFALAALLVLPLVHATPPSDPICAAPNSLDAVLQRRAELAARMAERAKLSRARLSSQAAGAGRVFSIIRGSRGDSVDVRIGGPAGEILQLEAATDLKSGRWEPWLAMESDAAPFTWNETLGSDAAFRFFRLRSSTSPSESVSNFRLLDHQGKARDLFYHTHMKAMVVYAAGNDLAGVTPVLPLLNDMATRYEGKIQTWILLSDPNAARSNVVKSAQSLGISFPVLLDRDGWGALAAGLKNEGEVVVVQPPTFTVAYRGLPSEASQQTASETFLGQALAALDTGGAQRFLRTPVRSARLANSTDTVPDYASEIAPILNNHCAVCHRPEGVAPFALTNYSVVQQWSGAIKHAVLSNKMPPWHADPEYGKFTNDVSLPGAAKAKLIRWLAAGAPKGNGSDPLTELPLPPSYTEWPADLGEPDAIMTLPGNEKLQSIKATGAEAYRYKFVQTPNTTNVWLKAAMIRPTNYRAVHHYLVWRGRVGQGGIDGLSTYEPSIAGFVPGMKPARFPGDAGVMLTASNWLTFNLHYTPYGQATNDQPTLALWYHRTPPAKRWQEAGPANIFGLNIPPYAEDHPMETEWTASSTVRIHSLNPHMHVRGKRISYEAFYPNGSREILLSVPDYDFNWQTGYQFATPKEIPSGTRIRISGAFDNSAQNLSNPDPSATVNWGDQSWAEMFVGFFDFTN